jgi:hypothetical protein
VENAVKSIVEKDFMRPLLRQKNTTFVFTRAFTMTQNDQHFVQLLYIFHASAMQSMGKLKNPVTDTIERNLEQARQSIGMLEMIKEKTQGNLSEELSRALDGFLTELRLNYIDETAKDKAPAS